MSELQAEAEFNAEFERAKKRWRSVDINYMPVYQGGQKQFDQDCQTFAVAYWKSTTLVPQLVAALKAARGFIASTSHSVTGIERQIDAAIAAGEGR